MKEKEQISIESDHLNEIAPHLSSLERHPSFKVPESYFDHLPAIIQTKCNNHPENLKSKLVNRLVNSRLAFTSVALLIALSIVTFKYFNYLPIASVETVDANEEVIIEENLQEVDEVLLVDALNGEEVHDMRSAEPTDQLENYMEENIELSTIINELN